MLSSRHSKGGSSNHDAGCRQPFADTLNIYSLTEDGRLLARPLGHAIQELITSKLLSLPPGSILLVDLSQVKQASHTALREIVAALAALRGQEMEQRYLLFHVDVSNEELVESLELLARDRRDVIPVINSSGSWHTLGRLTKSERDTLEVVLEREEVTTRQLSERFRLLSSAASNRLRRLYDMRLVQREERLMGESGGREYVYRPLFPR